jgi:uncharacterized protein YjbJ (UPF0337 family)
MAKSAKRNQTEGFMDRIGGRIMEAWGALTGNRSAKAKGKGAGFRGRLRGTTGRAKRAAK